MRLCRYLTALLLVLALGLAGGAAQAAPDDYAAQVVRQLSDQGYRQIEVRRSLLGKLIVTGSRPGLKREIVIDPRNGELLRDLVRRSGGALGGVKPVLSTSGQGGREKSDDDGRNGRSDDDDDDDDGDDDDDDDDGDSSDSDSDSDGGGDSDGGDD
ncbi:MAG: hypothetical protein ACK5IP_03510 [Paracoccus sp. (in: a-proteobacteria)]